MLCPWWLGGVRRALMRQSQSDISEKSLGRLIASQTPLEFSTPLRLLLCWPIFSLFLSMCTFVPTFLASKIPFPPHLPFPSWNNLASSNSIAFSSVALSNSFFPALVLLLIRTKGITPYHTSQTDGVHDMTSSSYMSRGEEKRCNVTYSLQERAVLLSFNILIRQTHFHVKQNITTTFAATRLDWARFKTSFYAEKHTSAILKLLLRWHKQSWRFLNEIWEGIQLIVQSVRV